MDKKIGDTGGCPLFPFEVTPALRCELWPSPYISAPRGQIDLGEKTCFSARAPQSIIALPWSVKETIRFHLMVFASGDQQKVIIDKIVDNFPYDQIPGLSPGKYWWKIRFEGREITSFWSQLTAFEIVP